MSQAIEELGPIDYALVEWPDRQPDGEALPYLVDLVDRGLIRVLDLVIVVKDEDGAVTTVGVADLGDEFAVFEGASSGLLGDEDIGEAGGALEPGTTAAERARRAEKPGHPHRGGVRRPESETPRRLRPGKEAHETGVAVAATTQARPRPSEQKT